MFLRRIRIVCAAALYLVSAAAYAQVGCPAPVIVQTFGANPTCAGMPVTLDAGSEWASYLWSNGATTRTITVTPPATTTYSVTTTLANGCSADSVPYEVAVNAPPIAPEIHLMMPESCPGSTNSAYIDPPPGEPWAAVLWSVTNATITYQSFSSVTFTTDPGGAVPTVTVLVTDNQPCTASSSTTVPVRTIPPPVMHLMMPETCPGSANSAWIDPPDPQNPYENWANAVWTVTNGTITYQSTSSITFTTDPGGQPAMVAVIATDNQGCSNTASQTVPVRSIPPPVMHLMMPETCPGSPNSAWIDPPDPQNPYENWANAVWTVTNGTITYQSTSSITFTTDPGGQPATVTVIATDNQGCSNTASQTVPVRSIPPPVMHLMMPETCPGSPNSAYIDPPDPQNPYTNWSNAVWTVTNGTITYQSTSSITFTTDPGGQPATVAVIATDNQGCTNTASQVVPVRVLTPPEITTQSPDVCPTSEVYATVAPPDGYSQWQSYSWTVTNAVITSQNNSSSIIARADGTAPVTLTVTVTDSQGCTVTSTKVVPLTTNPPTAVFSGPQTVCAGARFSVTATDPNNPGRYYGFASPNATFVSGEGCCVGVFDAGAAGTTIDIYVTSANSSTARCESWGHMTITVVDPPTATITASGPTTFCPGGSVTLSASDGTGWLWSNGATTQTIVVSDSGSYTVTVSNAGCSAASAPVDVTVRSQPVAILSVDPTACAGVERVADAQLAVDGGYVTGATFDWSITNGTLTSINGSHVTFVSNSGPVTLTVTGTDNNGCTGTKTKTIDVYTATAPTISTSGATTFCDGNSVQLISSPASSYLWSTGETTQWILATQSGSYTVTAGDSNGCTATSEPTVVTVHPTPAAPSITAGGPTTFCAGGSVTLTSSSAASYEWSTGATTQSITVSATGSYFVTVTDANGCFASSAPTDVIVNPLPAATITAGGPTTFCAGGSVTLTASAASSYSWSNGATTQSITVGAPDNYTVTVTDANGCSTMSAPTTVTVNPLPTPAITPNGPTTFCAGGSVTLTASAASSYAWSNGATTQSITVSAPDSYTVTVTDANGCSAMSAPASVTVNPLPTPTITPNGPTTFCAGGSVTLTASAASSYSWSNGATTQSITVGAPDNYTVTVTDANGCSAMSAPTTVTVNALPDATVTPDGPTTFCTGDAVTLTASAGASYAWSNGATSQSIIVADPGSYHVTVTSAEGCSRMSAPAAVTVNTRPAAAVSGTATICLGSSATISATLTGTAPFAITWSDGATQNVSGTTATRSVSPSATTTYTIVSVTDANCSGTAGGGATITVNQPPSFAQPPNQTIPKNTSTTLTVNPTGTAPFTYQWYRGSYPSTTNPVATTQSYTTPRLNKGTYTYWVRVTNTCGVTSSTTITVTAN